MTNTIYIHQPEKAFSFTRLPNFLFEAPTFQPLSNEAKVLYDDLTRLDDLLVDHSDFFRNAYVAVDAFDGFTVQEYRVLRHALRHAEKVSVSLCCNDLDTSRKDLFSTVRRPASRLMRLAKESGTGVLSPVYCRTPYRFQNDELRAVESTYAGHVQQADTAENVCVFRATSPYEEADFTAAKIRNLVLHERDAPPRRQG